jgi:hypothetical protein
MTNLDCHYRVKTFETVRCTLQYYSCHALNNSSDSINGGALYFSLAMYLLSFVSKKKNNFFRKVTKVDLAASTCASTPHAANHFHRSCLLGLATRMTSIKKKFPHRFHGRGLYLAKTCCCAPIWSKSFGITHRVTGWLPQIHTVAGRLGWCFTWPVFADWQTGCTLSPFGWQWAGGELQICVAREFAAAARCRSAQAKGLGLFRPCKFWFGLRVVDSGVRMVQGVGSRG